MSVTDNDASVRPRLLEEFPPHSYAMWRKAAEDLLKGAPFEKRLITPTYEGFDLQPIYNRSDVADLPHMQNPLPGFGSRLRGRSAAGYRGAPWLISQELVASDPTKLNQLILRELGQGQNELNLWFDSATRAGMDPDSEASGAVGVCGCSAASKADFATLLETVQLPAIALYLRAGAVPEALAALCFAAIREQGADISALRGCMEADPLGYLVETGSLRGSLEEAFDGMGILTRFAVESAPGFQTIGIQGQAYHNGGASSVQEMAAVLATGAHYIREMLSRGFTMTELSGRIRLSLAIGSQYFIEIAKFRAMRLVWNQLLGAFGAKDDERAFHLHARTGLWNKTKRDPYVNSLRATTEAFAAVVGGVDSLHVGAFDEVLREPDEFSYRFARNVHHVLAEECDLAKVIDPAGGSWAVESLTDQMAKLAWEGFQKIEAAGGLLAVLESGSWQESVRETLKRKKTALAQRRDTLVGSNQYPNAQEKPLEARTTDYPAVTDARHVDLETARAQRNHSLVEDALEAVRGLKTMETLISAAEAGATLAELTAALRSMDAGTTLERIPLERGASDFEALVERVAGLGAKASILQVNFGPSRRYRARADWTSAFFRVGGFPVLSDDDFVTVEEAVEALRNFPGRIAVLTSDDETYAAEATNLARALKQAKPELILLQAGAPNDSEATLREAGIDDFVHVRVNNYAFNESLAARLGAGRDGETSN